MLFFKTKLQGVVFSYSLLILLDNIAFLDKKLSQVFLNPVVWDSYVFAVVPDLLNKSIGKSLI